MLQAGERALTAIEFASKPVVMAIYDGGEVSEKGLATLFCPSPLEGEVGRGCVACDSKKRCALAPPSSDALASLTSPSRGEVQLPFVRGLANRAISHDALGRGTCHTKTENEHRMGRPLF